VSASPDRAATTELPTATTELPTATTELPSATIELPGVTMCVLCAGDTLGSADDHPGGQGARVRALAESGLTWLTEVECLDVCESDVLVVRGTQGWRRRGPGAAPVWLSQVAGEEQTAALTAYLKAGGPGASELPDELAQRVVPPPATCAH